MYVYTVYIEMIRNDDPSISQLLLVGQPKGFQEGAPRSPYDEANVQDFLPHSWCWRHKTVLVACVCLAALGIDRWRCYQNHVFKIHAKKVDRWVDR